MSRDAIVYSALPLKNLSYGVTPETYAALLFPSDKPQDAHQMAQLDYSCALTARAILRLARVDGTCTLSGKRRDVLRDPYVEMQGLAVALLIQLAQENGLWKAHAGPDDMQPGTVVLIEGPDHVMTVTGRSELGGVITLTCIEGGQPDPANDGRGTAIREKTHMVSMVGSVLTVGRTVRGCFDAGSLPCLPELDTMAPPSLEEE